MRYNFKSSSFMTRTVDVVWVDKVVHAFGLMSTHALPRWMYNDLESGRVQLMAAQTSQLTIYASNKGKLACDVKAKHGTILMKDEDGIYYSLTKEEFHFQCTPIKEDTDDAV